MHWCQYPLRHTVGRQGWHPMNKHFYEARHTRHTPVRHLPELLVAMGAALACAKLVDVHNSPVLLKELEKGLRKGQSEGHRDGGGWGGAGHTTSA